jgi:hypothetical protein
MLTCCANCKPLRLVIIILSRMRIDQVSYVNSVDVWLPAVSGRSTCDFGTCGGLWCESGV